MTGEAVFLPLMKVVEVPEPYSNVDGKNYYFFPNIGTVAEDELDRRKEMIEKAKRIWG